MTKLCSVLAFAVLVALPAGARADGGSSGDPLVGKKPPATAVKSWLHVDRPPRFAEMKGQVVHVLFCARWVRRCKTELIPQQAELKNRRGHIAILLLAESKSADELEKEYPEVAKLNLPVGLVEDAGDWETMPRSAIIGRDGRVAWASKGFPAERTVARALSAALSVPAPASSGGLSRRKRIACSKNILENLFARGKLTADDLLHIWLLQRNGFLPEPARDPHDLGRVVFQEHLKDEFRVVEVFALGEDTRPALEPGDLLVFDMPAAAGSAGGAMLLVEDYDPKTMKLDVVIHEEQSRKTRSASGWQLAPPKAPHRIRLGIFALRPTKSELCSATEL